MIFNQTNNIAGNVINPPTHKANKMEISWQKTIVEAPNGDAQVVKAVGSIALNLRHVVVVHTRFEWDGYFKIETLSREFNLGVHKTFDEVLATIDNIEENLTDLIMAYGKMRFLANKTMVTKTNEATQ